MELKHKEREMLLLKDELNQMWKLVISQLQKAKQSFLTNDVELAREVVSREKRVNAFELKIDSDCENYIALYSPVAIDLRLTLSIIKISNTLERIADFSAAIARYVVDNHNTVADKKLIEELQIAKMFDITLTMLSDGFVALDSENTKISGKIIGKDEEVDVIYHNSIDVLTKYMKEDNNRIPQGLNLLLLIRKIERIGDHCSNIVEEIVFYVDAKVLKHSHNC
ncbi:MAG: phosphate signaling complex protein PhoU [Bacteroides sp.]|nr:phosphate signaling complex protein PhoU [Bacteroides sp.]